MVSRRVGPGESGKIRIGCLMTLLLLVVAGYFGFDYFRVRLRFFRLQDGMKTRAAFAAVLDDGTIRRQLAAQADSLGIPIAPKEWAIRRTYDPRYITISARYVDSFVVDLPGVHKVFSFTFTPRATAPF